VEKNTDIKTDQNIKTFYTCPMHPEVREDKPGTCPTCGMKLEAQDEQKDNG
jgi:hypothetical protein